MEKFKKSITRLRTELRRLAADIRNLPPNTSQIARNCAIVSSKIAFKHNRIDARYYVFNWQYDFIADKLEKMSIERAVSFLENIKKNGVIYESSGTIQLHPEVIKNLKEIL